MSDIVFSESVGDVTQNLMLLHSYARGSDREQAFHFDRIYNAEHQVYYKTAEGPIFAPVKWCGAKNNSIDRYADRKRKISQYYQRALSKIGFKPITLGQPTYDDVYREFLDFCHGFGFKSSAAGMPHSDSRPRKFWTVGYVADIGIHNFPDEIIDPEKYPEGATKSVPVNVYERNPKARLACIAHYGWRCRACDLDFAEMYGERGKEFIHVHHIRALHEIGGEYEVDPINDLRPVCPNCHAMIHRSKPYLTVEELSAMLQSRSS